MFTEKLLQQFTDEEIEAILVHEIGHSRHRHLLLYPFILMGMLLVGSLIFIFILQPLLLNWKIDALFQSDTFFSSFILFFTYALFLGLYFRFVFGFFSRLFERQADLHIFEYSSPPTSMIQALDHIATLSGSIHQKPSWHHFSIQERINFLQAAIQDRRLVVKHHRKVKMWLWLYFILFGLSSLILIYKTSI